MNSLKIREDFLKNRIKKSNDLQKSFNDLLNVLSDLLRILNDLVIFSSVRLKIRCAFNIHRNSQSYRSILAYAITHGILVGLDLTGFLRIPLVLYSVAYAHGRIGQIRENP